MARPRILVTNDDGVSAPGIRVLVEEASKLGEVVVVAPDSPQSGQGHAITISSPIRLKPVKHFGDILAYECSGTPVDSVKLAKNVVMKDQNFDLCVSGINHGSNVSVNILYSGTMSAAMEASLEGVDSIGFSFLDYSWEADFDVCRPIVRQIMEDVLKNGLGDCRLLNVNIPKLPAAEIKGIRISRQAEARWVEKFHEATDPRGQKYYWLTGEFVNNDLGEDTDVWALENGYVSVVPSGHDLTHHQSLDAIRGFLRPTIH
ncbi:MAG: 5'/3'-nucleotidase SurE [Bacteroidota bacterium]